MYFKYTSKRWGEVYIRTKGRYQDGSEALEIIDYEGIPVATLTVFIPSDRTQPPEGYYLVKTWSENEEITRELLDLCIFRDTGWKIPTGYVEASLWKFTGDKK